MAGRQTKRPRRSTLLWPGRVCPHFPLGPADLAMARPWRLAAEARICADPARRSAARRAGDGAAHPGRPRRARYAEMHERDGEPSHLHQPDLLNARRLVDQPPRGLAGRGRSRRTAAAICRSPSRFPPSTRKPHPATMSAAAIGPWKSPIRAASGRPLVPSSCCRSSLRRWAPPRRWTQQRSWRRGSTGKRTSSLAPNPGSHRHGALPVGKLPFDADLKPQPAFEAIAQAFTHAPQRAAG